jgi:hypothetical protein
MTPDMRPKLKFTNVRNDERGKCRDNEARDRRCRPCVLMHIADVV